MLPDGSVAIRGMRRIEDVGLAGHGLAVMVPGELGDLVVAAHEGEPRGSGVLLFIFWLNLRVAGCIGVVIYST